MEIVSNVKRRRENRRSQPARETSLSLFNAAFWKKLTLTLVIPGATLAGPAEEGPRRGAVMVDVGAAPDVVGEAHAAALVAAAAPGVVGVAPGGDVGGPGGGDDRRGAGALLVVGLGLQQRDEHVARLPQVQLVQPVVLGPQRVQPRALGRLHQRPALRRDARPPREALRYVVRYPVPHVLDVRRRAR